MTEFAIPAVIGGIGVSAFGQLQAGKNEQAEFEQRAAVDRAEAAESQRAGREQGRLIRAEGRRFAATQRAGAGGKGIQSFTGAPLLLQQETISEFEREAGIAQAEGATTASQLLSQAEFDERTGKRRRRASIFGAGSSILTGGGSLALALRN